MNNVLDKVPDFSVIGGADGPTSIFLAGKLGQETMIAAIVIGVLFCVLGLKLIKVISALMGFSIGAGIGIGINRVAGLSGITSVIIIFGCAVVLAVLAFFLYRLGVFLMTVSVVGTAAISFIDAGANTQLLVVAAASLVLGILAAVFVEPGTIIITSLAGGFSAGMNIAALAGMTGNKFIGLGIALVLAVIGMAIQFLLYSRKSGKKEKIHAKKAKKKDSMESEVEKARLLLDDEDDDVDE